jgi:hypothetical protein
MLNVLHAPRYWVAQLVGALPPIMFFGVVEIMSRVTVSNKWLTLVRVLGSTVVGSIAGYESYIQQMKYVEQIGYAPAEAHWWPAIVDGSMAVFTVSLIEVHRKVKQLALEIAELEDVKAEEAARLAVPVPAVPERGRPGPKPRREIGYDPRTKPPRKRGGGHGLGAAQTAPLKQARVSASTPSPVHAPEGLSSNAEVS